MLSLAPNLCHLPDWVQTLWDSGGCICLLETEKQACHVLSLRWLDARVFKLRNSFVVFIVDRDVLIHAHRYPVQEFPPRVVQALQKQGCGGKDTR